MGTRKDLSCHACNLMIMICNPDNHDYQQMLCSSGKSYQHWRKDLCRNKIFYFNIYFNLKANWPGQAHEIVSQNPQTPSPLALTHSSLPAKVFSAQKKQQKFCRWSLDVKDGVALLRAGLHWLSFQFILTCGECSFKSYPLICLTFGWDDVRAQTLVLLIVPEIVNGEADG